MEGRWKVQKARARKSASSRSNPLLRRARILPTYICCSIDGSWISLIFCGVMNLVPAVANLGLLLDIVFGGIGNTSLLCVLGSHLLIHLREAAEEGRNESTDDGGNSLDVIGFQYGVELSDLSKYG